MCMYICIYAHIHTHILCAHMCIFLNLNLSICIYIYIYIYTCVKVNHQWVRDFNFGHKTILKVKWDSIPFAFAKDKPVKTNIIRTSCFSAMKPKQDGSRSHMKHQLKHQSKHSLFPFKIHRNHAVSPILRMV